MKEQMGLDPDSLVKGGTENYFLAGEKKASEFITWLRRTILGLKIWLEV